MSKQKSGSPPALRANASAPATPTAAGVGAQSPSSVMNERQATRPSEPDRRVVPDSQGTAGVWQNDKRVGGLWSTNESRNSWVLIDGDGWKKLSAQSDSAELAMTLLASHAKSTQSRVDYREESDGCIHEMYVW